MAAAILTEASGLSGACSSEWAVEARRVARAQLGYVALIFVAEAMTKLSFIGSRVFQRL